jgi:hypothetical protein
LYTPQAAQLLISLLLPFRNQIRIAVILFEQVVIQFFRDCLAIVVQVIDVPRALMMNLEDRSQRASLCLVLMRLIFDCSLTYAAKSSVLPSFIFCAKSSSIGSTSSKPAGGRFARFVLMRGILVLCRCIKQLSATAIAITAVATCYRYRYAVLAHVSQDDKLAKAKQLLARA